MLHTVHKLSCLHLHCMSTIWRPGGWTRNVLASGVPIYSKGSLDVMLLPGGLVRLRCDAMDRTIASVTLELKVDDIGISRTTCTVELIQKVSTKAKEHRQYGILGGCVVGCPLSRREKARRCSKVIIWFPVSIPSARVERFGPDPPLSRPCRINTKSKHQY